MKTKKSIIITGTHHTPAIELIHLLKKDDKIDWQIFYFSHQYATETHISHTLIPKLKVKFTNLECGKFDRKNIDKTIVGIPKTIRSFFTAYQLIKKIRPNIIVSFGGYVSVPVILASFFNKVPSITHEQTLTNSLATRINSLFASKVALSFDNDKQKNELPHHKVVVTGNLIRQEIFKKFTKKYNKIDKPFVYFTGGNQGSVFLNQLVYKLTPQITQDFSIIHQTGRNADPDSQGKLQKLTNRYFPVEFVEIEDIGWVLNNCCAIVSRSGANICQEIDALDQKSILIPHPATQQDEQNINAGWLKTIHPKTTVVIPQDQVDPKYVYESLLTLHKTTHKPKQKLSTSDHPLFRLIHEIST